MTKEPYKTVREVIAVIIAFLVLLVAIIFCIKHTRRICQRLIGATFKTEIIQDGARGKNQFTQESSKYAVDGDYHILFELAGDDTTTITDADGNTYQNRQTESITKRQTYTYAISGCTPGKNQLKVTIIGDSFCRSYFIPFEVLEER